MGKLADLGQQWMAAMRLQGDEYAISCGFASDRERLELILAGMERFPAETEHWLETDGQKVGLMAILRMCRRCHGTGQTGMTHAGAPIECGRCKGFGYRQPRTDVKLDDAPFLPDDE